MRNSNYLTSNHESNLGLVRFIYNLNLKITLDMLNKFLRSSMISRIHAVRAVPRALPIAQAEQSVFQQQEQKYKSYTGSQYNFAQLMLLGTAFGSYMYLHETKDDMAYAAQPGGSEMAKENKLRFGGTPQQIYKYFATMKDEDGDPAMSYADFFHAATPATSGIKSPGTKNYFMMFRERVDEVMKIADMDKNGSITFAEFLFFILVMQTPSRLMASDFKKAGGMMSVGKLAKTIGSHKLKTNFNQKTTLSKR